MEIETPHSRHVRSFIIAILPSRPAVDKFELSGLIECIVLSVLIERMWRRHQVDRLLEKVDAVVYLLDYTKLKTREEADVLRRRIPLRS